MLSQLVIFSLWIDLPPGVIGPQRMLGPGSIYSAIQWYWLVGASLPILFFTAVRLFPKSPARLLNAPVMLGAMGWLPP
jgi:hypothetical protein